MQFLAKYYSRCFGLLLLSSVNTDALWRLAVFRPVYGELVVCSVQRWRFKASLSLLLKSRLAAYGLM